MKKVYCIIVTYNGGKWIGKCLSSLRSIDYRIKTVIVDNNSTDDTLTIIQEKFPEVDLIESATNMGFGKANNIGIQKALNEEADFVFLLNQDAYWCSGSFKGMIESLEEKPDAGILSPVHLAGNEQELEEGFRRCVNPKSTPGFLEDIEAGNPHLLYESSFVNAAAWLIKATTIRKVGIFHPIFDHYGEDNEYAHRIQSRGLKVYIYSKCAIVHDRAQRRSNIPVRDEKYAVKQKQGMIVKLFTGEMSERQIHLRYFMLLTFSLVTFKLTFFKATFNNWIDFRRKINNMHNDVYTIE